MDRRLLAWAHANRRRRSDVPPLWLFTDARRLPDPRPVVARLPRGLAGVVLRHDGDPDRAALGADLARICRARRLALVVAGDARLAATLHAGVHLRSGRWPGPGPGPRRRGKRLVTSSAHGFADLRLAHRAGAKLAFLSPVFPTLSHPGAKVFGPIRWSRIARASPLPVAALGGVDGGTVRRLPLIYCRAIGGIAALT
jgi:thiamine-phosphate pyrophosphorylase